MGQMTACELVLSVLPTLNEKERAAVADELRVVMTPPPPEPVPPPVYGCAKNGHKFKEMRRVAPGWFTPGSVTFICTGCGACKTRRL